MADLSGYKLTDGDTPFATGDPRTFPAGYNDVLDEIERLDADKLDLAGGTLTGGLTIEGPLDVSGNVTFTGDRITTPTTFGIEPGTGLTWLKFARVSSRDYIEIASNDDIDITNNSDPPDLLARIRNTSGGPQTRLFNEVYLDDVLFAWFPGNGFVLLDNINEVRTQDGSASDPPYTFVSDESTGMYLGGSPQIAIGGSRKYHIANTSFTGIGNNEKSLGHSSHKWTEVWAVDGTINTSDGREKEDVVESDLGLDFINNLLARRWHWRGKIRPHYGLVAQEVRQALDDMGVTDFAGYIDPAVDWEYDEEDPELSGEEPPSMGLRYHEFFGPVVKAIQELSDRMDAVEAVSPGRP